MNTLGLARTVRRNLDTLDPSFVAGPTWVFRGEMKPLLDVWRRTQGSIDRDQWLDEFSAGVFLLASTVAIKEGEHPPFVIAWNRHQAAMLDVDERTGALGEEHFNEADYTSGGLDLAICCILFACSPLAADLGIVTHRPRQPRENGTPPKGPGPDVISVVVLRSVATCSAHDLAKAVDWACRWLVRRHPRKAHTRQLKSGRVVEVRAADVRGHVKGPADAPFRPRFYDIRR